MKIVFFFRRKRTLFQEFSVGGQGGCSSARIRCASWLPRSSALGRRPRPVRLAAQRSRAEGLGLPAPPAQHQAPQPSDHVLARLKRVLLAVGGLAFLVFGVDPFFLIFCPCYPLGWTDSNLKAGECIKKVF